MSTPLLTEKISQGGWHLAPALSPDGSLVAYFSEKDFYFVDMYLADGNTGKVIRRLLKSTFSSNYETYRYINSSAAWSSDGRAWSSPRRAAGRRHRDRRPETEQEIRRIRVRKSTASPARLQPGRDQDHLFRPGGGLSDLFIIGVDGKGLQRLTNDNTPT
jgi:Tol biopolymer transport system component